VLGVLLVLGIGTGVAVAANQNGGGGYSGPTYYPEPADDTTTPTDDATTPDDESTTDSPTWADAIAADFVLPDSCDTDTVNASGAEYVLVCDTDTDAKGNSLSAAVTVRFIGWESQSAMDEYLDGFQQSTGYAEDKWHFDSDPSVPEGRYIDFTTDDGNPAIAWSWEDRRVTGEATSACTVDALHDWWTGISRG
jgi:hypothetical protein